MGKTKNNKIFISGGFFPNYKVRSPPFYKKVPTVFSFKSKIPFNEPLNVEQQIKDSLESGLVTKIQRDVCIRTLSVFLKKSKPHLAKPLQIHQAKSYLIPYNKYKDIRSKELLRLKRVNRALPSVITPQLILDNYKLKLPPFDSFQTYLDSNGVIHQGLIDILKEQQSNVHPIDVEIRSKLMKQKPFYLNGNRNVDKELLLIIKNYLSGKGKNIDISSYFYTVDLSGDIKEFEDQIKGEWEEMKRSYEKEKEEIQTTLEKEDLQAPSSIENDITIFEEKMYKKYSTDLKSYLSFFAQLIIGLDTKHTFGKYCKFFQSKVKSGMYDISHFDKVNVATIFTEYFLNDELVKLKSFKDFFNKMVFLHSKELVLYTIYDQNPSMKRTSFITDIINDFEKYIIDICPLSKYKLEDLIVCKEQGEIKCYPMNDAKEEKVIEKENKEALKDTQRKVVSEKSLIQKFAENGEINALKKELEKGSEKDKENVLIYLINGFSLARISKLKREIRKLGALEKFQKKATQVKDIEVLKEQLKKLQKDGKDLVKEIKELKEEIKKQTVLQTKGTLESRTKELNKIVNKYEYAKELIEGGVNMHANNEAVLNEIFKIQSIPDMLDFLIELVTIDDHPIKYNASNILMNSMKGMYTDVLFGLQSNVSSSEIKTKLKKRIENKARPNLLFK